MYKIETPSGTAGGGPASLFPRLLPTWVGRKWGPEYAGPLERAGEQRWASRMEAASPRAQVVPPEPAVRCAHPACPLPDALCAAQGRGHKARCSRGPWARPARRGLCSLREDAGAHTGRTGGAGSRAGEGRTRGLPVTGRSVRGHSHAPSLAAPPAASRPPGRPAPWPPSSGSGPRTPACGPGQGSCVRGPAPRAPRAPPPSTALTCS